MTRDDSDVTNLTIGPYRLLERIGEGGLAHVYLAEQSEPVRRQVALKMLKAGMDSKQIVARFESERQALALLEHPGIAIVFDGGVADNGRPYFVMEYVRGVPLTDYCDSACLPVDDRVRLFVDVCRAVQHAHLKGLIHRDLKPSNILVGDVDGVPRVKVIDFGVAKAVEAPLTESSPETRIGQVIGTPQYMSPEQVGLDIDTRADVYSLGAVLYELLVGAPARDLAGVRNIALPGIIRESVLKRPSVRFHGLGSACSEIASLRATTPEALTRLLKGDLDWIVMQAVERDRSRRYETADALAADCERFLNREVVLARPPSVGYRLSRFARRNRLLVSAAASITALLVTVVIISIAAAVNNRQQAEQIAAERDRAETSLAEAQAVRTVMEDILLAAEPTAGIGPNATILEGLDSIVARFGDTSITDVISVDATVRVAIGNVYTRLGRYDDAEVLIRQAYDDRVAELGSDHPEVAETLFELAEIEIGRARFEAAADYFRRSLEIRRTALDATSVRTAHTLNRLGWALANQGDVDGARAALEESMSVFRVQEDVTADLADPISILSQVERLAGNLERSERLARESLEIRERLLSPNHTKTGESYNNLAVVLDDLGDREEAVDLYRRAIVVQEAIYGPDSEPVAATLNNLGIALRDLGRVDEGLEALVRAWEIDRAALGDEHLYVALDRQNLAATYCEAGQPERGREHIDATIVIYERELGADHWQTATARSVEGICLWNLGLEEEAHTALKGSAERLEREFNADNVNARLARERLQRFYAATGRGSAEPVL